MSKRSRPPYRADHVGSLLRPPELIEARARRERGEIDADGLREVEDRCIADAVRIQESAGLEGVTDGEYRRTYFHIDFLERIEGVEVHGGIGVKFRSDRGEVDFSPPRLEVTGKLRHASDIQLDDYRYLAARTARTAKVCIPSPTMLHFRGGRAAISADAYPDLDGFFADLAGCYRAELASLADAGCRYVQLDDTNLAYLCDPELREGARARGEDPDALPHLYARIINDAIRDRHPDMAVCVHLCRGNFKSAWVAAGGYEPVAEALFNELEVDGYFLEYDDERSGDFAPLRHVPSDRIVVLGLVTTKRPELEPRDLLRRRIDEAAKHVDLDHLCLSPQCGFSSTAHGNEITPEDQAAKLSLVVETADAVWG